MNVKGVTKHQINLLDIKIVGPCPRHANHICTPTAPQPVAISVNDNQHVGGRARAMTRAAAVQFGLDEIQCNRIMVQELG
jgi:hypothetical protein